MGWTHSLVVVFLLHVLLVYEANAIRALRKTEDKQGSIAHAPSTAQHKSGRQPTTLLQKMSTASKMKLSTSSKAKASSAASSTAPESKDVVSGDSSAGIGLEVLVDAHATLRENMPINTTVGILSVFDKDDYTNFKNHTFHIVEGEQEWTIGGEHGNELKAMFSADYETQKTYFVKVKAVDPTHVDGAHNSLIEDFIIQIIDENDVKPYDITLHNNRIYESTPLDQHGRSFVGKVTFKDPDTENRFSFHLGGEDNQYFTFVGHSATLSGILYTTHVFDYDDPNTKTKFSLSLSIDDGSEGGDFSTVGITIDLLDRNDEAPSNCELDGLRISENDRQGIVGAFSYTDPDSSKDNNVVTLHDESNQFELVDNELRAKHPLDAERDPSSYPMKISVDDGVNKVLECSFTVQLLDKNDNRPHDLQLYPGDNSGKFIKVTVAEDVAVGHTIAKATFSDLDRRTNSSTSPPEQEFTLSFEDDVEGFLAIKSDAKHVYTDASSFKLVTGAALDYETRKQFKTRMVLTDGKHYEERGVEVIVVDVNDEKPFDIELEPQRVQYSAKPGEVLSYLEFEDPDTTGSYSATLGGADAGIFELVPTDNDKKYMMKLKSHNYSADAVFLNISITVKDGVDAHAQTRDFKIPILGETQNPPHDLAISNTRVKEGKADEPVGEFSFDDVDDKEHNLFTFTIQNVEPKDNQTYFKLGQWSRDGPHHKAPLFTAQALDYETRKFYVIEIIVSDSHSYTISDEIRIDVEDVNDNLPEDIRLTQNEAVGVPVTYPTGLGTREIGGYPSGCTGETEDAACDLVYLDRDGNEVDVWAMKTNISTTGRYPGWVPLCPTRIELVDGSQECYTVTQRKLRIQYQNPEVTVAAQTPYCEKSNFVEFFADGLGNPDYIASDAACVNEVVDCEGYWGPFSACSKTCGGGVQRQSYRVVTLARNGGALCPHTSGDVKSRACNTERCEVEQWRQTAPGRAKTEEQFEAEDMFGRAAAISPEGTVALVGAPGARAKQDGAEGGEKAGVAYIYSDWDGEGDWTMDRALQGADLHQGDQCGTSVAITEKLAAVGCVGYDHKFTEPNKEAIKQSGAVFLWVRDSNDEWKPAGKIEPSTPQPEAQFGSALALAGNTLAVGAKHALGPNGQARAGAVFVYDLQAQGDGSVKVELLASLAAKDADNGDAFGSSVALSNTGDALAVGAPDDDTAAGTNAGTVHLFRRESGDWVFETQLSGAAADGANGAPGANNKPTAAAQRADELFGKDVSLVGNTLAVGAPGHSGLQAKQGAVFLFSRVHESWTLVTTVSAGSKAQSGGKFGETVSLASSEASLAVGAPFSRTGSRDNSGSAFIFRYSTSENEWQQQIETIHAEPTQDDHFGSCLALTEGTVFIGAWGRNGNGLFNAGAVYVYSLSDE